MKNFLFACGLLALSLLLTVCNASAVCRRTETLTELAAQDDPETLCAELADADSFFSLTIHHALLEQVQQAAGDMRAFHGVYDPAYQAAKDRLLILLQELREGEKFSFFNIF